MISSHIRSIQTNDYSNKIFEEKYYTTHDRQYNWKYSSITLSNKIKRRWMNIKLGDLKSVDRISYLALVMISNNLINSSATSKTKRNVSRALKISSLYRSQYDLILIDLLLHNHN